MQRHRSMGRAGTLRTLTLNTGFDDTFTVSGLAWGGLGRVHRFASLPSGKGVNAARAAAALGRDTCAYALVGREDIGAFAAGLDAAGVGHRLVAVDAPTRHNLTILLQSGEQVGAHLVGSGYTLADPQPARELIAMLLQDCRPGDLVTCNGSVPAGVPAQVWADTVRAARSAGAAVAVDVQGEAMRQVLRAGGLVLAKPNETESEVLGTDVPAALAALQRHGVAVPVITLGARGAAYLQGGHAMRAWCPVPRPLQAVGAGDAFMAGAGCALLDGAAEPDRLVAAGLAAAAAHVAGASGVDFARLFASNLTRVRAEPW